MQAFHNMTENLLHKWSLASLTLASRRWLVYER